MMQTLKLWCLCVVVGLSSLPWPTQACQCPRPVVPVTLKQLFQSKSLPDVFLQATLLKKLNSTSDFEYSAKIIRIWKGCHFFKGLTTVTITTPAEESLCGVLDFKVGTTYFLSGVYKYTPSRKYVSVGVCDYHDPWNTVNASQKNQLEVLSRTYTNCSCTPNSCGPRPNATNYLCADFVTIGGPGKCSYNQIQGKCGWETVQCPSCQKQSDCLKGQFCATGRCRALGTCGNIYDCWNPNNQFTKSCAGAPTCTNSKCALNCSKPCPGSNTVVQCPANPCATTPCKTPHSSCAPNYCGSCRALFYNSSGYRVCN